MLNQFLPVLIKEKSVYKRISINLHDKHINSDILLKELSDFIYHFIGIFGDIPNKTVLVQQKQ